MRPIRHAARIILLDQENRLLLFRFAYTRGPLAGTGYWGVPGGGVEQGEPIAGAALRELLEETGIRVDSAGPEAAESSYPFRLSTGVEVTAHDHYFIVKMAGTATLSRDGLTEEERENLVEWRWWSLAEIRNSGERIVPPDLAAVLMRTGMR